MARYLLTDFRNEFINTIHFDNRRYVLFEKIGHSISLVSVETIINHLIELNIKGAEGRLLGECGTSDSEFISLSNVSHKISNLELIDRKIYGDVDFLNTPRGNLVQNLISMGIEIKFKIHAIAPYYSDKIESFEILTWNVEYPQSIS